MIAKIKTRTDFSGIVNYANDKEKKAARVIGSNGLLLINNETMTDSFMVQLNIRDENGRLHNISKPVKHISIAYSPEDAERFPDNVSGDNFMKQLAEEWMKEMGINPENTQYVIVRHFDKDHPHCHLVYNRIQNDGSLISDSLERRRNIDACKKIKVKHGLTFGNPLKPEINENKLRKYEKARNQIRTIVTGAKMKSSSWKEFENLLSSNGVTLNLCFDKKGNIKGVAYEKDGFRISGSRLGSHGAFTYGTLSKKFQSLAFPTIQNIRNGNNTQYERSVKNTNELVSTPVIPLGQFLMSISVTNGTGQNREWEVGTKKKKKKGGLYL